MGRRASVLVVEDNDETRYLLERMLILEGYAVHSAEHGADALRWLHAGNRPSVIVLDFYLPIMDGDAFLRAVQAEPALSTIPVVGFTARGAERPAGLAAFVRKGSADPDVLLSAIEGCLGHDAEA